MAVLKLEIVTPEAKVYSEDVDMVTLPGVEGEMGIFPMHIPLMTQIAAGEIVARKGGQDFFLAVGEGFVEVTGDRVAILTDMAIQADDIDETRAEEARKRAEAKVLEGLVDCWALFRCAIVAAPPRPIRRPRRPRNSAARFCF
jgi:F-type H+-transporting ATPase subunit epsilon